MSMGVMGDQKMPGERHAPDPKRAIVLCWNADGDAYRAASFAMRRGRFAFNAAMGLVLSQDPTRWRPQPAARRKRSAVRWLHLSQRQADLNTCKLRKTGKLSSHRKIPRLNHQAAAGLTQRLRMGRSHRPLLTSKSG